MYKIVTKMTFKLSSRKRDILSLYLVVCEVKYRLVFVSLFVSSLKSRSIRQSLGYPWHWTGYVLRIRTPIRENAIRPSFFFHQKKSFLTFASCFKVLKYAEFGHYAPHYDYLEPMPVDYDDGTVSQQVRFT